MDFSLVGNIFKLKEGDEQEIKKFYEEYVVLFIAFANHFLSSEEECKDVVHDVFLSYWEQRKMFDDIILIRAFFYKSIRNKCLNIIRHRQIQNRYEAESLMQVERDDLVYKTILQKEIAHMLHHEIQKLTGMEQKVLLAALHGKSNEEIAEEFHIAIATVKSYKAKAYAQLRLRLHHLSLLFFWMKMADMKQYQNHVLRTLNHSHC